MNQEQMEMTSNPMRFKKVGGVVNRLQNLKKKTLRMRAEDMDEIALEKVYYKKKRMCEVRGRNEILDQYSHLKKYNFGSYDFNASLFSFITGMFHITRRSFYTLIGKYWLKVALGVSLIFVYAVLTNAGYDVTIPLVCLKIHSGIGIILAFLFVFRSNVAYAQFYMGRMAWGSLCNNTRSIVLTSYTHMYKIPKIDRTEGIEMVEDIRRMVLIFVGLVRHAIRESAEGFVTGYPKAFNKDTWYLDPQKPRLYDLLLEEEVEQLSGIPPPLRATVMLNKIQSKCLQMSVLLDQDTAYFLDVGASCSNLVNAYNTAKRINDTPIPFQYTYLLNFCAFCFLYLIPFGYGIHNYISGYAIYTLVIFAFYACMHISYDLEQPFGWDMADLDLEAFCVKLQYEVNSIAESYIAGIRYYTIDGN